MDKKDIYEHLAKIYLDASQKRKKKSKTHLHLKKLLFLAVFFFASLGIYLTSSLIFDSGSKEGSSIALVLHQDVAKINFNFKPAKKEILALDLNGLNINRFHNLTFSAKKGYFNDYICLRIEFINAYREKSEVYIKDIPHKWSKFKIPLSDFRNITDWSEMKELAFIVEDWNTKQDNGLVYIENVSLTY